MSLDSWLDGVLHRDPHHDGVRHRVSSATLNHITLGTNTDSYWALAIYLVARAAVAALWLWASPFTIRRPRTVQKLGRIDGRMNKGGDGVVARPQ